MCEVSGFFRSSTAVTQPSSLGIITSSVMTFGAIVPTLSRQSCPSTAVDTSNPSSWRFTAISCLITSSSSTTRTRPSACVTRARLSAPGHTARAVRSLVRHRSGAASHVYLGRTSGMLVPGRPGARDSVFPWGACGMLARVGRGARALCSPGAPGALCSSRACAVPVAMCSSRGYGRSRRVSVGARAMCFRRGSVALATRRGPVVCPGDAAHW